jgi:hypothetical protein
VLDFFPSAFNFSTDNARPYIQAAINYCTDLSNRKQTLYFPSCPAGLTYRITTPLVISGRLSIIGDGPFSTIIQAVGFTSGQYILDFDNLAADDVFFGGVQDIKLASDNSLAVGMRIKNVSYMLNKNVYLSGLLKGIYITGTRCFSNFFEQVTTYSITDYGIQIDAFTGGGQYMFSGCTFTGGIGFLLSSTSATDTLGFYNCNFEQCVTNDAYIAGTVNGLTFSSCRSEGFNGVGSFLIEPVATKIVSGLSVTGCFWATDAGNSYPVYISGGGGSVKGFAITGNRGAYTAGLAFVGINGAGEAGIIAGNYFEDAPAAVSVARAGITVFNNSNSSGALPEYWGTATWKVEQGSYTATGTGMTTSPTATYKYSLVGNSVTLDIDQISGTSNSADFTITGMPASIRPAVQKQFFLAGINNGSSADIMLVRISSSGVITLYADSAGNGFVASGTKALKACSISYTLA